MQIVVYALLNKMEKQMRHYWYDADADIMYIACLQNNELIIMLLCTILCWETIKYLLFKLK